ncbi:MAG: PAS domain S-box protein [Rhodoplanes sp.]|uniref:PAS domain S-box protein n=1 Tax=Rhodoplanes sp. TaxID=1968906 RepID=UPI0017E2C2D3|nr:PAS domain S-box protein [Rhodoplanes sp.]NVO15752.1 PAS domain S-box protein [Rhodoplanes sp.]
MVNPVQPESGSSTAIPPPASSAGSDESAFLAAPLDIRTIDQERLYVAAVESSIHAFITIDFGGVIAGWSPGAERMFGYSADEAIGAPIDLIFPPGEVEQATWIREMILQGSRIETYEAVRVAKDGRTVNVVATLSPIRAASGEIVGICSILTDVTNQRLAEQLFGLVVEACPSGMIVSDQDGSIVLVNSATERLFGYSRGELLGQTIELLVPERMRSRHTAFRGAFARHAKDGRPSHGRVMQARCKDGSEIEAEIGLNPILIEGRQMVLSVIFDVRERQRIERMKNEFIATVSHELRTPLTSITGSLGLLLGGAAGPQTEPAKRLLTIAQANSLRLVRLVNDMLDIEKIESGQVVFNHQETDIRALVEDAIEANRGFSEQFQVRVMLAPDAECATVCVDADRIVQVVTNLLSNACKFSPAGGEVEVRIERANGAVRVSVRDQGPGIPEEFKPRVFSKFAQAESPYTRQKGGSGLGLNIVKQIVVHHGGQVGFAPAPGGGTIFHIDLPAVAGGGLSQAMAAASQPQRRAMMCSRDFDGSSALCGLVRSRGFVVDFVATASAALARAALGRYALFVVDLPMRDLDGVGLIRQLRMSAHHAATPIVVAAPGGWAGNADLRYDDLGIVGWLDKPADCTCLARILDRIEAGKGRPRVLHVEDDRAFLDLVGHLLKGDFDVVSVASLEEARQALQSGTFDASLLDLGLPDGRGTELLPYLRDRAGNELPVVVHSGSGADEQTSARAEAVVMKAPGSIRELVGTLRRILKQDGSHQRSGGEVA